jgi:uncharacterized membrane protein YbhN (UPF0104 family)
MFISGEGGMTQERRMKSIWYFIGLVLFAMGLVLLVAGIVEYGNQRTNTVLAGLHADIWWGCLMMVVGAVFYLTNRNSHHE